MSQVPAQISTLSMRELRDDPLKLSIEIDQAFQSTGCFYLTDHGIRATAVTRAFERSRALFALPSTQKANFAATKGKYGYSQVGGEQIRQLRSAKEAFNHGDPRADLGHWPSEHLMPGFRDPQQHLYEECSGLMKALLNVLDVSAAHLGLKVNKSLARCHTGSNFTFSCIHYPDVRARPRPVQMATHQDISTASFVFLDSTPGLQVADKGSTTEVTSSGVEQTADFIPVMPVETAIVVLTGFHMQRFVEEWSSAFHRVCIDHPAGSPALEPLERYSIAFFAAADEGTTISSQDGETFSVDESLCKNRKRIYREVPA